MESAKCIANKANLIFLMFVLGGGVQPFYPQSQIIFRQLSVKEGLSQNSAISITQDSIGYLWIATQDGLNKYDGRKFSVFPYTFLDITKPDYSNLGKVYNDRQGGLWIIPSDKIPRKFDPKSQKFQPLPEIDDASVIYQGRDLNVYIGTYSEGLYVLRPDTIEPEQVLPFSVSRGNNLQYRSKQCWYGSAGYRPPAFGICLQDKKNNKHRAKDKLWRTDRNQF